MIEKIHSKFCQHGLPVFSLYLQHPPPETLIQAVARSYHKPKYCNFIYPRFIQKVKLLSTHYHEAVTSLEGKIERRIAARGVILKENLILLMYTSRYNDYSLPGGGVDANESIEEGLVRELEEETGARNIQLEEGIGIYEEFRPARHPDYDILHMISHIYKVACDEVFDLPKFESYELKNGMKTVWIDINKAIDHNRKVIERLESSMGLSIRRELFLLESIRQQYLLCGN